MRLSTFVLCLALFAVSGAALAERPSPEDGPLMTLSGSVEAPLIKRSFDQFDTDHDGRLSQAETISAALTDSFWELDRNRDGFLSRQEYDYHPN
ncbi:EF-hand domain-containing protein [Halomonas sp. KM-1]|uniref:EF-hand domain-containing protein n=1 Tax=Halomonas sp. KM-1 TaxID=590061 RepID=UPI00028987D5|nr:EF-hand domain-containing protein [Halomonas sp. KM-1]